MRTDVLIVGGGPAGLSAAIAAGRKGLRVTLVDARRPPMDKPCGEGLLPEAAAALRALGVELDAVPAHRFSGIRFSDAYSAAEARFGGALAFGVRRTTLHALLAGKAQAAGASLLWGSRVTLRECSGLHPSDAEIDGRRIAFRWLVGADGMKSHVRAWAGLNSHRKMRGRFAFRRHYAMVPWTNLVEVHWADGCEIIVTPTSLGEVCVALFTRDHRLRIDAALERFPELRVRLKGARATSSEAGALTALGRACGVVKGNVVLLGDASCSIDGIAGQGLNLAFREAIHLGEALARENLASYAIAHSEITETARRMTRLLLLMARYPWVRRKALRALAAKPELFSKMISIHAVAPERESFGLPELFGLGWQVLLA
jgi:2-polyprenyl-6-methoxyphenol hydroxylase-like FAD-dependent oxidoreductase